MAIPQQPNAMFYHPLDNNLTESLIPQVWSGFGVSFIPGKVAGALAGGSGVSPLPGVYPTGVGATRLAFSAWTRSLGPSVGITTTVPPPPPFFGRPAQVLRETDRTILTAMGFPASDLGGFT